MIKIQLSIINLLAPRCFIKIMPTEYSASPRGLVLRHGFLQRIIEKRKPVPLARPPWRASDGPKL